MAGREGAAADPDLAGCEEVGFDEGRKDVRTQGGNIPLRRERERESRSSEEVGLIRKLAGDRETDIRPAAGRPFLQRPPAVRSFGFLGRLTGLLR